MFYRFGEHRPVCAASSFVHPQATVIGDVIVGERCYIGPGAVLRGDWGRVVLADGCNVQEGCCVHMFPGVSVRLGANAHVGHGAVIHGATLEPDVLVGMNAVVMDRAVVGAGSIVGALAFVKAGLAIPPRSLFVGNPGKVVGPVSDERAAWKREGTELYQTLPRAWRTDTEAVEPLREAEPGRPAAGGTYGAWGGRAGASTT